MNRLLAFVLITFLTLVMLWGSSSWYFAKVTREAFDAYLQQAAAVPQLLDIELLDYKETLTGAQVRLTVNTPVAAVAGQVGEVHLLARSLNGPVLITDSGIRFGTSQWQITVDETEDAVVANTLRSVFDGELPQISAYFDFFDQLHLDFSARQFIGAEWQAKAIHLQTQLGLLSGEYQAEATAKSVNWRRGEVSISAPDIRFDVNRVAPQQGLSAEANAAVVDFLSENLNLKLAGASSGVPLNLRSRSSLWLNNDTLSGDLDLTVKNPTLNDDQDGLLSVQFRDWRTEGLLAYWRLQSQRASLLQQAEWALEEVDTPEQQDFLWRLLDKADRIEQKLGQHLWQSLLVAERSSLDLNVGLRQAGLAIAQLNVKGAARTFNQHAGLQLEGDFRVDRQTLSPRWQSLMTRWQRRLWLRKYENEYEADIKLRDQQLLINAFRVSASQLAAELKRVVADQ